MNSFNKDLIFEQRIRNFELLLKYLQKISPEDKKHLIEVEKQTAMLLREKGEDINGLLVMAWINLLTENRQKALSFLNRIWDLGGELTEYCHIFYLNTLIGVGLLEMAAIMLKDKFENIENHNSKFDNVMMKFAISTGNLNLIKRILPHWQGSQKKDLNDLIGAYQVLDYGQHFKITQKIVNEFCKNELYAYDYKLYHDRGFVDLEIVLYVGKETANHQHFIENLNKSIDNYFQQTQNKRVRNQSFEIRDIKSYQVPE
ncbi:MAG: hypothetical protein PHE89_04935 [Alphaproteobacteria bacterium]|nr:hypothetical protein [Alphaproteobacteria bacterium]